MNKKATESPCENCPHGENKDTCQTVMRFVAKSGGTIKSKGCKEWTYWYTNAWRNLQKSFGQTDK